MTPEVEKPDEGFSCDEDTEELETIDTTDAVDLADHALFLIGRTSRFGREIKIKKSHSTMFWELIIIFVKFQFS